MNLDGIQCDSTSLATIATLTVQELSKVVHVAERMQNWSEGRSRDIPNGLEGFLHWYPIESSISNKDMEVF